MSSTCAVSFTIQDIDGNAIQNTVVQATPTVQPLFYNTGTAWVEMEYGAISASTDSNGNATLNIYWPSVCDPSSVKWLITLPDGTQWQGAIPDGNAGPLTLKTLKDSYGWGLVTAGTPVSPYAAITGLAGTGINWTGAWSSATAYVADDAVSYTNGSSYICIAANTNQVPTNATYWNLLAQAGSGAAQATTTALGTLYADVSGASTAITEEGLYPAATSGAPTTGTYKKGQLYVDVNYALYECITTGTPGTFVKLGGGGAATEVFLSEYASLSAALTAIGSNNRTLVLDAAATITSTTTVPANVILRPVGAGIVTVATGGSLAVLGPVLAAPGQQWISSALTTPVTFGAGAVPEVWVQWFGAKGDAGHASASGTDSGAAIQQAINSLSNGGLVRVGSGTYRSTVSLTVIANDASNHQHYVRLKGVAGYLGEGKEGGDGSVLLYDGASASPLIEFYSNYCRVEDIYLGVCDTRTMLCAVDIDAPTGTGAEDCTRNAVRNCGIGTNPNGGGTCTYGIRVGNSAAANIEYMAFEDLNFNGVTTAAIYIPDTNANTKRHRISRCIFNNGSQYCIQAAGGSWSADHCAFLYPTGAAIYVTNAVDALSISDCDSEGCTQLISFNSEWPLSITGCRFSPTNALPAPASGAEYIYKGGGMLYLEGNLIANNYDPNVLIHNATGSIVAQSCYFPNLAPLTSSERTYLRDCQGYYDATNQFQVLADTDRNYGPGRSPQVTDRALRLLATGQSSGDASYPIPPGGSGYGQLGFDPVRNCTVLSDNGAPNGVLLTGSLNPPNQPGGTLSATGGTITAGNRYYYVTFATAAGETTASSYMTVQVPSGTTNSVALFGITLGPPGTTGRNIYFKDDGHSTPGLLHAIADNTTTSWTDTGSLAPTYTTNPPASDTSGIAATVLGAHTSILGLTATSATAGTHGAVPSQVAGYLTVAIGGTTFKVPYFSA